MTYIDFSALFQIKNAEPSVKYVYMINLFFLQIVLYDLANFSPNPGFYQVLSSF